MLNAVTLSGGGGATGCDNPGDVVFISTYSNPRRLRGGGWGVEVVVVVIGTAHEYCRGEKL